MPLTNGRGDPAKQAILASFKLTPITHTLVPGQQVVCCCGDRIAGGHSYHLLRATPRLGQPREADILYAGDGCARSFVRLDPSIKLLPLADPFALAAQAIQRQGVDAAQNGHQERAGQAQVAPLTREVAAAHAIFVLYFGVPRPGGALDSLAQQLAKIGTGSTPHSMVRAINSIARKSQGLAVIWNRLIARYDRDTPLPTFPLMQQILAGDSWMR